MGEELIIKRYPNRQHSYDYEFDDGKNILRIFHGGTLDLYFELNTRELMPQREEVCIDFNISKDNNEIYKIFDRLYNKIIDDTVTYKNIRSYSLLVDKDKRITWRSEEDLYEYADRMTITKEEDNYRLSFIRVPDDKDNYLRNGYCIGIRICNSGCTYYPYNTLFMEMYNELQKVDPEYHQIDMEEVLFHQKVLSKKK